MIVVAGEALIDLAPRGEQLLPLPGGSPYNVAIGLGRLERTVDYLGVLSRDGFGERMAARLAAEGVALDLAPRSDAPTTLAVVHLDEQARASYGFYLDGTSASALTDAEVAQLPADATILHVSFGAVTAETDPAGRALVGLLRDHAAGRLTSLDPNIRPGVIPDMATYAQQVDALVAGIDLVKVSDEDLELLHPGADDVLDVAARWAASGPGLVVVTRGPDGAVAVRADGAHVEVAGQRVDVVDTVGAGDAFTSGLLAWIDAAGVRTRADLAALDDTAVTAAMRQAMQVAAITCTRAGSDPPRLAELG